MDRLFKSSTKFQDLVSRSCPKFQNLVYKISRSCFENRNLVLRSLIRSLTRFQQDFKFSKFSKSLSVEILTKCWKSCARSWLDVKNLIFGQILQLSVKILEPRSSVFENLGQVFEILFWKIFKNLKILQDLAKSCFEKFENLELLKILNGFEDLETRYRQDINF